MIIHPDAQLSNADWTKRTWDLPYKSEQELKDALGAEYEKFKHLPVYNSRPWSPSKMLEQLTRRLDSGKRTTK